MSSKARKVLLATDKLKRLPREVPTGAGIYIFDFCGTLVRGNTTLDFISYLNRRGYLPSRSPYRFGLIKAGLLRRLRAVDDSAHIRMRISCLRGMKRSFYLECCRRFWEESLAKQIVPQWTRLLADLVESGARVTIATRTLEQLVRPFMECNGISELLSSRLHFDDLDICSGGFEKQIESNGKLAPLKNMFGDDVIEHAVYLTDTPEADIDMLDHLGFERCVYVAGTPTQ